MNERIIPRRIAPFSKDKILSDLERYRKIILQKGAEEVKIIEAKEIRIDERVRAKCLFPKCSQYGTNANCPPYVPDLSFARKLMRNFQYGLFFYVKAETEDYLGDGYKRYIPEAKRLHVEILEEIESRSFYDGYYFSVAFGQGSCKSFFCPDKPCSALEGKGCRFPLKARSSLEAMGIDVFGLCAKYNWEVYPCGRRLRPGDVPHVLLVGLIMVV